MSGRRVFLIVVVSLLVIAVLFAAGVCLYRMGYAQGVAQAGALPAAGPWIHPYGMMPGFGDGRFQEFRRGDMFFGGRRPFGHFGLFGFGGGIVGFVLLAGFVALVVAGVNALTRKQPTEVQAVAAPMTPPVEPAAPAPTRGTRRSRSS